MKKTYIAPKIESLVINPVHMLAASQLKVGASQTEVNDEGKILSKGFGGGLWEEDSYDE